MNDYQKQALGTIVDTGDDFKNMVAFILGLSGEAGEVTEKYKKIVRDKNGVMSEEDKLEIIKELGDVMWYIAVIADKLGYSMDEVAGINLEKLYRRKDADKLKGSGDNR